MFGIYLVMYPSQTSSMSLYFFAQAPWIHLVSTLSSIGALPPGAVMAVCMVMYRSRV